MRTGIDPSDNLSHHASTWIEVDEVKSKQGRGFWCFNTTMLKNLHFLLSTKKIIRDTIKEYSVQDFVDGEVDNDSMNQCESRISPILLMELILAKVRENTIKFLAQRSRKLEDHLSECLDEKGNLEKQVNDNGESLPHI